MPVRLTVALKRVADRAVALRAVEAAALFKNAEMDARTRQRVRASERTFRAALRNHVFAGDYRGVVSMFGNSSDASLRFLMSAYPLMSEQERAECLADVWQRGGYGEHAIRRSLRRGLPLRQVIGMFRRAPLLAESARRALFDGRQEITVWRGAGMRPPRSASKIRQAASGVAWTTSRRIAVWFALRYEAAGGAPMLLQSYASPDAVLAYFNEREEHECIVDSRLLRGVGEVRITGRDRAAYQRLIDRRRQEAESRLQQINERRGRRA
jgi:hypothetical protein